MTRRRSTKAGENTRKFMTKEINRYEIKQKKLGVSEKKKKNQCVGGNIA